MTALPSSKDLDTMKGEAVLDLTRDLLIREVHRATTLQDQLQGLGLSSGPSDDHRALCGALGAAADIITLAIGMGQDEKIRVPKGPFADAMRKFSLALCKRIADQARTALMFACAAPATLVIQKTTAETGPVGDDDVEAA